MLLDLIIFQLEWWLCTLSGNQFIPYGYVVAAFILFATRVQAFRLPTFVLQWLILSGVGILNDSLMVSLRMYHFMNPSPLGVPYWLMVLWMCFAAWFLTAHWINRNALLMSALSAFGGMGAYTLGHSLGSIQFNDSLSITSCYLFIAWAILGFVFVLIYQFTNK